MSLFTRKGNAPLWPAALALALFGLVCALSGTSRIHQPTSEHAELVSALRRMPLAFELNEGQVPGNVKFYSRGAGSAFYLTPTETVIGLAKMPTAGAFPGTKTGGVPASVVRMRLAGGNPAPKLVGENRLKGRTNYIIGKDPSKWHTNIPTFARVRYKDIYPGIDLAHYGNQEKLEHDFIVKPGSNPSAIRIEYAGAQNVTLGRDGELLIHTANGPIQQAKPYSYQKVDGKRREVFSRYTLLADGRVGFEVGAYDPTRALVIDPVLIYTAFIGGEVDDYPLGITMDADRNIYLTGYTGSFAQAADSGPGGVPSAEGGGFPGSNVPAFQGFVPAGVPGFRTGDPDTVTPGRPGFDLSNPSPGNTVDMRFNFSRYDGFVVKLDPNRNYVFATYLGGSRDDYATSLAIGQDRSVYVTGFTYSGDFPTRFPLQGTTNDGSPIPDGTTDAFVTHLNSDGTGLLYSTYLGGSQDERGRGIAVDGTGNAHVVGFTNSADFPTVGNVNVNGGLPFQGAISGTPDARNKYQWDLFVASLDASGSAMNYSTFFGGSGDEDGAVLSIFGRGFGTGVTYEPLINPITIGSGTYPRNIQVPVPNNPTQFSPARPYGYSWINDGASGPGAADSIDRCVAIAVDPQGNAYIAGGTNSTDFFVTGDAQQPTKGNGYDVFYSKFDPNGLVTYSTFLGGGGDEAARSISLDNQGSIILAGVTESGKASLSDTTPFPTQAPPAAQNPGAGAFQSTFAGGTCDAFVTKLDSAGHLGAAGTFSTYLGGSAEDIAYCVTASAGGQVYVSGSTRSTYPSFPTRLPYQTNNNSAGSGGRDNFITKYRPDGSEYEYSTFYGNGNEDYGLLLAVDPEDAMVPVQAYLASLRRQFPGYTYATVLDEEILLSKFHAPPFQAANLNFTRRDQNSIDLVWQDQSDNEEAFDIERKSGSGLFQVVGTVGPGGDTVLNGAVTAAQTTIDVQNAQDRYVNNYIQVGTEIMQITAKAGNTLTVIRGAMNTTAAAHPNQANVTTFTVGNVTFNDAGLLPGTTYTYRVRPWNRTDPSNPTRFYGSYSNQLQVDTLPGPPAPPNGITATAVDNHRIRFTFTDRSNNEGDSGGIAFRIERRNVTTNQSFTQVLTLGPIAGTGTQKIIVDGDPSSPAGMNTPLTPSTTYQYRVFVRNDVAEVQGVDANGNPATVQATTLPDPPSTAPTDLTATAISNSRIDLAWSYPDDTLVQNQGFYIERAPDNMGAPGTFTRIRTLLTHSTTGNTYSDTSLPSGTRFWYRVLPFNQTGDGTVYSNVDDATTAANPPPAPDNLSVDLNGTSPVNIKLTFRDNSTTANMDEDGFKVDISDPNASLPAFPAPSNRIELAPNTGNAAPQTITRTQTAGGQPISLPQRNAVYIVRVLAFKRQPGSPPLDSDSNPSTSACVASLPMNVNSINVTGASQSSIDVNWQDFNPTDTQMPPATGGNPGSSSFRIERADNAAFTTNLVTVTRSFAATGAPGRNLTYTDTSVSPNQRYYYRVTAFISAPGCGGGGDQPTRPSAATGTGITLSPPVTAAPTVTTNPPTTSLTVTWATSGAPQYRIERAPETAPGSGTPGTFTAVGTVPGTTLSFTDPDDLPGSPAPLDGNRRYFYQVVALNQNGDPSTPSPFAGALTPPARPNPPTATQGNPPQTTVNLSWTEESFQPVGYRVQGAVAGGTPNWQDADLTTLPPNPVALSNPTPVGTYAARVVGLAGSGLQPNVQYVFRIFGVFNGVEGLPSNNSGQQTLNFAPSAPSSLTARAVSSSEIDLTWSDNSDNEAGFRIYRVNGSNFPASPLPASPIVTLNANTTHYEDMTLAPNTTYTYRVVAFNNGGSSAPSASAGDTTFGVTPGTPANLRFVSTTATAITLRWDDTSGNESGFKLERVQGAVNAFPTTGFTTINVAAHAGTGAVTYTDSSVQASTTYTYRVRATNNGADSPASNLLKVLTRPNAPSGLTLVVPAAPLGRTQINLSWTNNNPTGTSSSFVVERSDDAGDTYSPIATVSGTTYQNTNLSPNTVYYYKVKARSVPGAGVAGGGDSAYTGPQNATTRPNPPAAPVLNPLTVVSQTEIDLEWTDVTSETGYKIERKLDGGNFVQIATVGPNVTTYQSTGLAAGRSYTYQVRAFNTGGDGAFSNTRTASTLPNAPVAPRLSAQVLSQTRVDLSWALVAGATGYKIERKPGTATGSGTYAEIGMAVGNVGLYKDTTGLTEGTTYTYRIRATNAGGDGAYSNQVTVITLPVGPTDAATTALSSTQIQFSWTDNSGGESGYIVERQVGTGGFTMLKTLPANTESYVDTTVTAGNTYTYRVKAHNASGDSGILTGAPVATIIAPTNLTARGISGTEVRLDWLDKSANEQRFIIERGTAAPTVSYDPIATVGANVKTYVDNTAAPGTTYSYRVRASNASGFSSYTNAATAATLPPPAAPTNLVVTVKSSTELQLAWSDNSNNEQAFAIERSTDGTNFTQISQKTGTTASTGTVTFNNTGLSPNTTYTYRVRAIGVGGPSGYTNLANATTPASLR